MRKIYYVYEKKTGNILLKFIVYSKKVENEMLKGFKKLKRFVDVECKDTLEI